MKVRMAQSISRIIVATMLLLIGTPYAQARPDVRNMTCAQAKHMVQANGAVVFTFTNSTYDRVVKNRRYCDRHQDASKSIIVRTLDNNRCYIGKKCVEAKPFFKMIFGR